MCQLTFHCRLLLVLSLLHLLYYAWRLKHVCLVTEETACFKLDKGNSFSNPIKTRCGVTSKKCMYEEDVVADIWTQLCLDIPDTRLLCVFFLAQGERRGHESPGLHGSRAKQ